MIASAGFLTILVSGALLLSAITPLVLLGLLFLDWKRGTQW